MKQVFFSLGVFLGSVAVAQPPTLLPFPAQMPSNPQQAPPAAQPPIAAPGIPGPAPAPEAAVAYEVLEGTKDLGTFFYWMDKELKLQRGRGHSIAAALLATAPGKPEDKFVAFQQMLNALKQFGPTVYRETTSQGYDNRGRLVQFRTPRDVTSEGLMTRIAAVLTCKQGKRSAEEMAKMLKSAYNDAVKIEVEHPDTGEKLQWSKDLYTLLMVATLLK